MFKNRQKKENTVVDEVNGGELKIKPKNDDPHFDEEYLNRYRKFNDERVMNPGVQGVEEVVQAVDDDFLVN